MIRFIVEGLLALDIKLSLDDWKYGTFRSIFHVANFFLLTFLATHFFVADHGFIYAGFLVSLCEVLRKTSRGFRKYADKVFSGVMREKEKNGYVSGVMSSVAGMLFAFWLSPTYIWLTTALAGTVDPVAGQVGKRCGKHPLYFVERKTVEGTLAGWFVALVITLGYGLETGDSALVLVAPLVAIVVSSVELVGRNHPFFLNDNLLDSIAVALVTCFLP